MKKILIVIISIPLLLLLRMFGQLVLFQYAVMTPKFIFTCQWKKSEIVDRLSKQVGTNNCQEAYHRLISATELDLSGDTNHHIGDDLTLIEGFYRTTTLDLSFNKIAHLEKLSNLKELTKLNLSRNNIINIYPLNNLNNLTSLDLHSNQISDIVKPLAKLQKLVKLDLHKNKIVDIKSLENLIQLTDLNLSHNKVVDIKSLKNLKKLTKLDLSYNIITDVSSLQQLKNLTELNLRGNKIEPQICPVQPPSICKF